MKRDERPRLRPAAGLTLMLSLVGPLISSCVLYQPLEPSLLWHDFQATAYCDYGFTASGVWVRDGIVAGDPRVLPLGSVIDVKVGDEVRSHQEVMDTGGAVKGYIIDLWMPTCDEAVEFGRKQVKVRVRKRGDLSR